MPRNMRTVLSRIKRILYHWGSVLPGLYAVRFFKEPRNAESQVPYVENPEKGAANLKLKLERQASGGPFEWPNIVAANRAVVGLLGNARSILELGGGTGCFAWEASTDPRRRIVCSEYDRMAHDWALENRSRPNIRYVNGLVDLSEGPFDLVVAIDVIEHLRDFVGFLQFCCKCAPRAILTTPNRQRGAQSDHAGPPQYIYHVREWSAGEFYWVLRCFYRSVKLYAMPDVNVPGVKPIIITSRMTPLIADCSEPLQ